jgi:hypothetical protein
VEIGYDFSLILYFSLRADGMIAPESRVAFSTSQSSLFGPSEPLRSSASGSTLFATSASTLFGAVNVGLTQNQVRHSIPLRNDSESKLNLHPL